MQLYPTRAASHLAIAGVAVAGAGLLTRTPVIVAWGGALLVALALARAVTLVSVARIRAAGFEMLWSGPKRILRTGRGGTVEIEAEVRNRDTLSARYVHLRAVASSQLSVTIEPSMGEVQASGRLKVKVLVHCPRVGQHGVHGLSLEVRGAPGMFEVPLTFANPFGIEVLPRPFAAYLMQARGGRSRLIAASGRPGVVRGDGNDLRELREHQPGDPFRRIAWKATARRGRLMVRDFEREERDVVWLILDAQVELWAGPLGRAPLDRSIDEASAIAVKHLSRGDRVGLFIVADHLRHYMQPEQGPVHAQRLAHALITLTGTHDAERSELDESDVAIRVMEHLRPLDARGLSDVRRGDLDKLAQRADQMRSRAPFLAALPQGKSHRERLLRRYLAAFGIESPPRIESDRRAGTLALIDAFAFIGKTKPRASLVHVIGGLPDESLMPMFGEAAKRLMRKGITVTLSMPDLVSGLAKPWEDPAKSADPYEEPPLFAPKKTQMWEAMAEASSNAMAIRAHASEKRRERVMRKAGVHIIRRRPVKTTEEIHNDLLGAAPSTDTAQETRDASAPETESTGNEAE